MLVGGVDIPLIEVLIAMTVVIFIVLAEAVVVVSILLKQLNKTKQLTILLEKLAETVLQIKKAEIAELDKLHGRSPASAKEAPIVLKG